MIVTSRGIVIRQVKYSGSSVIAKIYTEKSGLKSFMIRGVRKQHPKISPSLLQPLTLIEIVYAETEKNKLVQAREIASVYPFEEIHSQIVKGTLALFINEVIYRSVREEEANPGMFQFLFDSVLALDKCREPLGGFHLAFMAAFSRYLGFAPNGSYCSRAPYLDMKEGVFVSRRPLHPWILENKQAEGFSMCFETPFPAGDFKLGHIAGKKALLAQMITYYQLHLPGYGEMNSSEVLSEVFR